MSAISQSMFLSLDPGPGIKAMLLRYKHKIQELVGEQLFLNDPPHLTVYLAAFAKPDAVLTAAAELAAEFVAIEMRVVGWHVFVNDPLTNNNTLILQLDEHTQAELRAFQRRLIVKLAPLRDVFATTARYIYQFHLLSRERRESVEEYGFPFTGSNWHPHFTVASIRPKDWPRVAANILSDAPHIVDTCQQLTVYQLDNSKSVALMSHALRSREAAA